MSIETLAKTLPGVVVTDPDVLVSYRTDRSGLLGELPLAVARPVDAGQVQDVVRWAAEHQVAVVPRGAGTGLAGGATGLAGAIVLSLERMRAIEIDPASRVAVVEPGALNGDVKRAAAEHGLWYPPDPSSFEICSIGGNVATNAGGLCCVKYGVTTDYVLGLDVVLADGTLVTVGGRRVKDVAGMSLTKLFVGSEGALGIVTRAVLRLVPAPAAPSTLVALFPSLLAAAAAVVEVGRTSRPSMVELMDRAAINAVEDYRPRGLDRSAEALLLFQSDAPGQARADEIAAIHQVCLRHGAAEILETDDPDEGEQFVAARRDVLPAAERLGAVLIEDVGVEVPRLPALLGRVQEVAARWDVPVPLCAHAGDGNVHPLIVSTPATAERAQAAFREMLDAAIGLGGTITGEHGVGRLKADALPRQLGPDAAALAERIKKALDPDGILNPGVGV